MRSFSAYKLRPQAAPPAFLDEEQKVLLSLSVMLMLSINFALGYLAYTNYRHNLLDVANPGFWLFLLNCTITFGIVLLTKWVFNWAWRDLGLARPESWWKSSLVGVIVFITLVIFSQTMVPVFVEFSGPTETDHLLPLQNNLPKLINILIVSWITSAFLEEVIFRGFLINSLDIIFGENIWSPWVSVFMSSVIFGLIHAYQGFTGILVTGSIGLIFGIAYLFNGRRIWPLIVVHGLVDTIFYINMYNS